MGCNFFILWDKDVFANIFSNLSHICNITLPFQCFKCFRNFEINSDYVQINTSSSHQCKKPPTALVKRGALTVKLSIETVISSSFDIFPL